MPTVEVFDPPLCCSSGVCGPDPDPDLARFAADLDWLRRQGVEVRRYNLAQVPGAFVENPEVRRLMQETGGECLPAVLVDGALVRHGSSPGRDELARWTGVAPTERPELALPSAGGVPAGGRPPDCCG